jgi:hypothetical protein
MFIFRYKLWTAIPGKSMVLRNFPISIALNVLLLLKNKVGDYLKKIGLFQDHAVENFPLSFGHFGKNLEESDITIMVKIEMSDTEGMQASILMRPRFLK